MQFNDLELLLRATIRGDLLDLSWFLLRGEKKKMENLSISLIEPPRVKSCKCINAIATLGVRSSIRTLEINQIK